MPQNSSHYTDTSGEYVRPVRSEYVHKTCGTSTTMGRKIAETYAKHPKQYTSTFCVQCDDYFPVAQFNWLDGQEVGQ